LAVDENDDPTKQACTNLLQSGVRKTRYLLKKKYFIGVPADQIRTTSPIPTITDEQWLALVAKWSSPKGRV